MSSSDGQTDDAADTPNVTGLEEFVPEPLMPLYARFERVQQFRATHGETYTSVLEGIVAAILIGGYLYWLFLYLTA